MRPFVLDASVAASWAFRDENDPRALVAAVWIESFAASAPILLWYELRNVLLQSERRGRINAQRVGQFLSYSAKLAIHYDFDLPETVLVALARKHRLTLCDAAYLELALRLAAPLATLDRELAQAAEGEGIELVGA